MYAGIVLGLALVLLAGLFWKRRQNRHRSANVKDPRLAVNNRFGDGAGHPGGGLRPEVGGQRIELTPLADPDALVQPYAVMDPRAVEHAQRGHVAGRSLPPPPLQPRVSGDTLTDAQYGTPQDERAVPGRNQPSPEDLEVLKQNSDYVSNASLCGGQYGIPQDQHAAVEKAQFSNGLPQFMSAEYQQFQSQAQYAAAMRVLSDPAVSAALKVVGPRPIGEVPVDEEYGKIQLPTPNHVYGKVELPNAIHHEYGVVELPGQSGPPTPPRTSRTDPPDTRQPIYETIDSDSSKKPHLYEMPVSATSPTDKPEPGMYDSRTLAFRGDTPDGHETA